ncbi:MAG TPA: alpha/beta fold hydrolase [Kofleriaceae bacterium]|nr:alpha/beta fold hydrolase [Kofleriaceae bacterium]
MNVAAWADSELDRNGDYEGLSFEGRAWSSRTLHEHAARFAQALRALGVTEGERVVVVLPNGPELVFAFPAILRAGAVAVLVHPGATAAEIERIVTHSEASVLVTSAALAPRAPAGGPRLRIAAGRRLAGWESFEQLVEQHAPLAEPVKRSTDDIAQITYTAGTTGAPKGVVFTHAMLAARLRLVAVQQNRRDPEAPMVLLSVLPMGHAFGTVALLHRFVVKTKLICMAEFDPSTVLQAIEEHRVEFAPLVPAMAEALLASPELGRRDVSSLRGLAVGGAPVSKELVERMQAAFGFRPTVGYGMTEMPGITFNTGTSKPGSVGRLIPGVAARIVDRELRDLPPGEVGEVLVKAPWMSATYYGSTEGASTKVRDGWLHTGDLGYFDADKELFLVGRSKEIIIQAGNNVYPHEVTEVLARMPGVVECAAVGVPNEFLGEEVVACVVPAPGATLTAEAVIAHCRAGLDVRKVPVRVHFVDALPKTELGKVKAHVLREQIERARAAVRETELVRALRADPAGVRRERLREAIEARLHEVLRAPRAPIDARTPFGDLGLDSLGAVELANALGVALGRALPATLTFRYPTVDAITGYVLDELFGAAPVAETRTRVIGEREPIAVIGVGCRMPGGVTSPAQLWALLEAGVDGTRDIDRWDMDAIYDPVRGTPGKTYAKRAALIDAPEMFDAEFFGLTPREASDLDPQHRVLLETVWEALEHAGRNPLDQRREHAGVFIGISASSYAGGNAGLGVLPSMAAGRISYFLDLDGPSFPIDTACSSSLVAIHNAVASLRRGECDLALAGGVNVMCAPEPFIGLSAIQALAPDGRCKAFDASGDGFGRGEGSVVFVLRRLADAEADRDRILGVIRGTAINHDGRSSSLTAPNGKAQEAVIRSALADAKVRPADIAYLEAHGTGTPLGDPIEVEAAAAVLGVERPDKLAIGSIKTNVAHLEAAAGAAGVLKVLLAFEHEAIPATLHQHTLNPMLAPFAHAFEVTATARPWRRAERPRRAGVTSLGMSGTNAHVVLEEPPRAGAPAAEVERAHVLPLAARSETALAELARRYADHLAASGDALADVCYTAGAGRAHFAHRLAVVAADRDDMIARLREHADAGAAARAPARAPKLGFMFTGQGSQYVGMGRRLYETERTFRQALQRCAELLQHELPRPLLEVLFAEPRAGELTLDDTALAQPALFALEWALAALWRSWGIEPAFVLGHSLGEFVAACVAGVFSVEDGLRLAAARGRLMQALPRDGAMVALATDEATVQVAIGAHADRVSISGINGPRATVLSGETGAVHAVAEALAARGVQARTLRVSHAFHSPLMEPILDEFERLAASIALAAPQLAWISTVSGQRARVEEVTSTSYWRRQIREPVRFADAITTMAAEGAEVIVELGPSPILIAMGQQCVTRQAGQRAWLPSLRRDHDDWQQILGSLGELYVHGAEPRWSGLYRDPQRKVALPTYPFERQRYWAVAWGGSRVARASTPVSGGSGQAPARESPRAAMQRELAALSFDERTQKIVQLARTVLGRVLGRATETLAADRNLLDDGLDSLRVMDFLGALRQRLGIDLATSELMARPSLGAFAAHVAGKLAPAPAVETSPLITLNGGGTATPVFCLHPSGGDATAYLRLRALLGDDVPLYAIQSRATSAPEREHTTLAAMAADYAEEIRTARATGPYILVGWSMGGVTAHAVAVELERAGGEVVLVGAIDSTARAETASELQQLSLALTGVIYDVAASTLPAPDLVDRQLRALFTSRIERDKILAWCEEHGLIAPGSLTPERFDAMMRLRYRHFQLVGEHPRGVTRAPMRAWWAERPLGDWAPHTSALVETVLGGNHFTVIRPPYLETIAAEIAAAARPAR